MLESAAVTKSNGHGVTGRQSLRLLPPRSCDSRKQHPEANRPRGLRTAARRLLGPNSTLQSGGLRVLQNGTVRAFSHSGGCPVAGLGTGRFLGCRGEDSGAQIASFRPRRPCFATLPHPYPFLASALVLNRLTALATHPRVGPACRAVGHSRARPPHGSARSRMAASPIPTFT